MNAGQSPPAWLGELRSALLASMYAPEVRRMTPMQVGALFSRRHGLPYQFLGDTHPIVDLDTARARGWAACADAAAAVGAAVVAQRGSGSLCIEAPRTLRTYTHVRVIVDTSDRPRTIDPYRKFRASVPASCEWVIPLRDFASGRYRLIPAVAS